MFLSLQDYNKRVIPLLFVQLCTILGGSIPKGHAIAFPIRQDDYQKYIGDKFADPTMANIIGTMETALPVCEKLNISYDMYKQKIEDITSDLAVVEAKKFQTITVKEFISVALHFNDEYVEKMNAWLHENGVDPNLELILVPENYPMISFNG